MRIRFHFDIYFEINYSDLVLVNLNDDCLLLEKYYLLLILFAINKIS